MTRRPEDAEGRPCDQGAPGKTITEPSVPLQAMLDNLRDMSVAIACLLAARAAHSSDGPAATWARHATTALAVVVEAHWLQADLGPTQESEGCYE